MSMVLEIFWIFPLPIALVRRAHNGAAGLFSASEGSGCADALPGMPRFRRFCSPPGAPTAESPIAQRDRGSSTKCSWGPSRGFATSSASGPGYFEGKPPAENAVLQSKLNTVRYDLVECVKPLRFCRGRHGRGELWRGFPWARPPNGSLRPDCCDVRRTQKWLAGLGEHWRRCRGANASASDLETNARPSSAKNCSLGVKCG
jgi:hypothetical protein